MVQCAVRGCSSRSDVHNHGAGDIHFHRVPKNRHVRSKWIQSLQKDNINESTRVCSLHFDEKNYWTTNKGLKRLVSEAFPDINLPPPDEISESSDDEEQAPNIVIVNQLPAVNTVVPNISQSIPTNIIVVPQSSTGLRIAPQIVNQILAPVNVVRTTAPYVQIQEHQIQGQAGENCSGNAPNEGNFENQVRTPLESKLMTEVKLLREAIDCLEEQNRRLLVRNNFLQQTLDNYERERGVGNNFDFKPDVFGL
ncbi:uncharacterized protein LOC111350275 [Spodoptera litura]|uniref:Uncharacterized protein LOC111350275 n=1 Tax=Spodoptera litura TaxID=69820 RepID=A0A9J7DSG6_SPOLT|nr:uncharacterized protein LOC111350275 [Spodoptera litura]